MAFYRLTESTFVNGALQEAGSVIEHDGDASPNMVEIDGATYRAERSNDPGPHYSYKPGLGTLPPQGYPGGIA